MQKNVQEFTLIEEDDLNNDFFELGRYDEEEDLFTKLQRKKRRGREMLRLRWCAGLVALFRASPSGSSVLSYVILRNVILILVYYVLSIGLTFYQNHLLKEIKFPLFIVLCHLVVKLLLASFIRVGYECWTGQKRILLDCDNWLKKLSLIGISGGLDIGFSNWGQEFITVSLYTMSKSTAIIFILGFALLLKLEEQHWSLIVIVGMISGGLFLFTYRSTQFNLLGFCLIMGASFLSGLRWSMCQLIVQKSTLELQNPIDMVYHVQPWMMIAVLPFALFFEGSLITNPNFSLQTEEGREEVFQVTYAVLLGAVMAFFMEIAEYLVVVFTSSLTLSVAGIFKEICTLCLAIAFNGDQISFINGMGLVMCMAGIICHVGFKISKTKESHIQCVSTVGPSTSHHPASRIAGSTSGSGVINSNPIRDAFVKDEESETPLLEESLPQDGESEEDVIDWSK